MVHRLWLVLLLCSRASCHVCTAREALRRLPWPPGVAFRLDGCDQLQLAHAGLGPAAASALSLQLSSQPSPAVRELNLFNNSVGDAGARALGIALRRNTRLDTLYLERNDISDEALAALGRDLQDNKVLSTLGLFGNELGPAGREAMRKAGFVGLEWADGEYKRNRSGRSTQADLYNTQPLQGARVPWQVETSAPLPTQYSGSSSRLSSARSPFPSTPPPPTPALPSIVPSPPIPTVCMAECGHASCFAMRSIGLVCDETRLVCGDACSECCNELSPPAPPPSLPPLAPCLDALDGCSLDGRGICLGAPSLAKKICMATCGLCETYISEPQPWLTVAESAASVSMHPRAAAVGTPALETSRILYIALALAASIAMALRKRNRQQQDHAVLEEQLH